MKIKKCRVILDSSFWGIYIFPLFGVDWCDGRLNVWFGWLFWLININIKKPKNENTYSVDVEKEAL
jgi:hypothetical protein